MNRQMISETEAVCVTEDVPPMSAFLDETEASLSEALAILDKIFDQVFGIGGTITPEEKASSMLEHIILTRDKSHSLMSGLHELSRRLGV